MAHISREFEFGTWRVRTKCHSVMICVSFLYIANVIRVINGSPEVLTDIHGSPNYGAVLVGGECRENTDCRDDARYHHCKDGICQCQIYRFQHLPVQCSGCRHDSCDHGLCTENGDGIIRCCCYDGWTGDRCDEELNKEFSVAGDGYNETLSTNDVNNRYSSEKIQITDIDVRPATMEIPCKSSLGQTKDENLQKIASYPLLEYGAFREEFKLNSIRVVASFPDIPIMVTAASQNHLAESLAALRNWHWTMLSVFPKMKLIYYDMGLTEEGRQQVKELCPRCDIRRFDYDRYPCFVSYLKYYVFKAIIFRKILLEFDFVMWGDASTRFKMADATEYREKLFNLARERGAVLLKGSGRLTYRTGKFMFDHIDENPCTFSEKPEIEATFYLMVANKANQMITAALVSCGLDRRCMAPIHSERLLKCQKTNSTIVGGCHRYEQSMMGIAMYRLYHPDGIPTVPRDLVQFFHGTDDLIPKT